MLLKIVVTRGGPQRFFYAWGLQSKKECESVKTKECESEKKKKIAKVQRKKSTKAHRKKSMKA
jgi:hypothetical protein